MSKANRCVVRNQSYSSKKVTYAERHNERKNEFYGNGDVDLSRSGFNIHFKQCEGSYLQAFNKLIDDGVISTRGLKSDAKIIDEMIFDVNTGYFEKNGGYEYAKSFFEEAYRMAVNKAGDERYILSAVMHADERNKAISEELGRDVFHFHLHVCYIPVVEKEILWSKRCKDPALVGTVKEVINQVSHSKKWKSDKIVDADGKKRLIYSYSLLQDRYYEHMREAGFVGFERGERGSTAEHLSVLEYKTQQETDRANQEAERAETMTAEVERKQETAASLDKAISGMEQAAAVLDDRNKKGKIQLEEVEKNVYSEK